MNRHAASLRYALLVAGLAAACVSVRPPTACRAAPAPDATDLPAWKRARALFAEKRIVEGRSLLMAALRTKGRPPEHEARVIDALAEFSEKHADSPRDAVRYWRRIERMKLPEKHPMKVSARMNIARVRAENVKWAKENAVLEGALIVALDPEAVGERIAALREIVDTKPAYPHLAKAYFFLGRSLLEAKRYGEAWDALETAQRMLPGLRFTVGIDTSLASARANWLRLTASRVTRWVLGGLLVGIAAAFFAGAPWRVLGARHLALAAALAVAWWAAFRTLAWWAGGLRFEIPTESFAEPAFASAARGSPGSGLLDVLFVYGLVGMAGAFALAAATARLRLRWTGALAGATVSFVLFGALLSAFYLRHVDPRGHFFPRDPSRTSQSRPEPDSGEPGRAVEGREDVGLRWLGGTAYVPQWDVEPYVLTDPKSYPGLAASNVDEPALVEWLGKHCPAAPGTDGDR